MRRPASVLLALCIACSLAACGKTRGPEGTSAVPTTIAATEPEEIVTDAPPEEEEAPFEPSYAVTDTYFYAVSAEWELYYAALDDLSRVKRMPLPVHYEGKWLQSIRIDKVDEQWIYLTAKAGAEYEPPEGIKAVFVQLRVALDTYICEFLETSETLPEIEPPEKQPPMDIYDFCEQYYHAYKDVQKVPRPAYEFTSTYAKTPTHIFGLYGKKHEGKISDRVLYRMPINDISQQQKIALPDKYDSLAICGLTEEWLFVGGGKTDEDYVTYRISLDTLKAEKVDEYETGWLYPRYNAAGNSLLYVSGHTVEALHLDTGKRSTVFDFNDYYMVRSDYSRISGWFNTPEGEVVLQTLKGWWGGYGNCFVFGEDNKVRIADYCDLPRVKTQPKRTSGKIEQELAKRSTNEIRDYEVCGDYVYYVEKEETGRAFYRVRTDGTEKKLLQTDTKIFCLLAVNNRLFCQVGDDPWWGGRFEFCALDENGKITKTIDQGDGGEWSWNDWERFDDFILIYTESVNGSENYLQTLYDPATTATFHAYEQED